MPVNKIPSEEVEIGMMVSSLDRPWSETSFLFQGFEVHNQEEIEELKKQARYVYIAVPDEKIELSGLTASADRPQTVTTLKAIQQKEKAGNAIREEIRRASRPHEEISALLGEMEEAILKDKELPVEQIRKSLGIVVSTIERSADAYLWLTRIKKFDSNVYRNALTASILATNAGNTLGLGQDQLLELATGVLLMDIGKTALPAELINKESKLSESEWELMKSHVEEGVAILEKNPTISEGVISVVYCHHERRDGSGYPRGLQGEQIPLLGQIAGLVDFYVAITNPRAYASNVSSMEAVQMLYQQNGRYFAENIVQHFIQSLSTYPTGSLVELSTGEVGIVISQNPSLRLKPNIILLLDPDKKPYEVNPIINLVDYTYGNTGNPASIAKALVNGAYGLNIEELTL